MGDYTPPIEDNLLGIDDRGKLNEEELRGVLMAREFLLDLEEGVDLDTSLILEIHRIAFGHLYEWAGKWRRSDFVVGQHVPPRFQEVPTLMYQFSDDLKFKLSRIEGEEDLISVIAFAHHQFVKIHPFNNGNGRTARLISDFIAFSNGYNEVVLYHREGEERKKYLKAIRAADNLDYSLLEEMIRSQLKPLT